MLIVTNQGELTLLDWAIRSLGGILTLRLFQNDAAVSPTTVAADLTEADYTGYSAKPLVRTDWSAPTNSGIAAGETKQGQQLFSFDSIQDIYGYYLTRDDNELVVVEKFGAVRSQVIGSSFVLTPSNTLAQLAGGVVQLTNLGSLALLDWALRSSGEDVVLRLYSNDYTPVPASVVGDFTEATFTGYSARTLTRALWGEPAGDGGGVAESVYGTVQTWVPTTDQDIFGFYVTNTAGDEVLWAHRFFAIESIVNGTDYALQPTCSLRSVS